jgi:predicted metal-dependent HD superfamily phosphohydrolase
MKPEIDILGESRAFVGKILRERLKPWVSYHDVRHTEETVEACLEIAAGCGLDAGQTEIVLIAAWFHDTGYTLTVEGHEERSATIAEEFLLGRGYPADKVRSVVGCIMATKMPQRPKNILENVVCDADMLYVGREEFFKKNDLLRDEIEEREGVVVEPSEWLKRSLVFLEGQRYHTEYCRSRLDAGLRKNIETLRNQLARSAR